MTHREAVGLPLAAGPWTMTWIARESAGVRARYVDDAGRWVAVVLMPPDTEERAFRKTEHCALRYEVDAAANDALRASVRELLEEVSRTAERQLGGLVGPLLGRLTSHPALPLEAAFDPEGVASLLPELAAGLAPSGHALVDSYAAADGGVGLEIGRPEHAERLVIGVSGRPERLRFRGLTLGPRAVDDRQVRGDASVVFGLATLLLEERAPGRLRSPLALDAPAAPGSAWRERARFVVGSAPRVRAPAPDLAGLADSSVAELAREARLLAPSLAACARYFGAAPVLARIAGAPVEAWAVTFPAIPAGLDSGPTFFHAADHGFRFRRLMVDYLARLGFRAHDDGLIRTVPTPASFSRLLDAEGLAGLGFRPGLYVSETFRVVPTRWLERWLDASYGLEAAPASFYRRHAPLLALRAPNRAWCEHLTALAHDMSVHVLATHRVPRASLAELGDRLRPLVDRCRACGRDDALGPLIEIYEEDLVQHCLGIWERLARPEDFEDAFARTSCLSRFDAVVRTREHEAQRLLGERRGWSARGAAWWLRAQEAAGLGWRALESLRRRP